MRHAIDNKAYHVEILTPKLDAPDIEAELAKFGEKYRTVMDAGYVVCITDNPMGHLSVAAMEAIEALKLPVHPDRLCIHLNTFHTKKDFDATLRAIHEAGGRDLLIVSGDGSQKLHRLEPNEVGIACQTVTSVELLRYIDRECPGMFNCPRVVFVKVKAAPPERLSGPVPSPTPLEALRAPPAITVPPL